MAENNYQKQVAEQLIEQLRAGTAPWQKPWSAAFGLPQNPVSGTRYKGGNLITLMSAAIQRGYEDPRWMTFNQASAAGGQVRRGEKGTLLRFTKTSEAVPLADRDGKPIFGEDGKPLTKEVQLASPKTFSFVVFNAQQIDHLAPLERQEKAFSVAERAEAILQRSQAEIRYGGDQAFYHPSTDSIHLPPREAFTTEAGFYATAMHELGHWTGHVSRLGRDLAHPFGSVGYAKEELRAEIASMMLGTELGTPHDPGQHAAYVGSWVKVLQDDHREIFRAAADAERIVGHILGLERQLEVEQTLAQATDAPTVSLASAASAVQIPAPEKTLIDVPYMERYSAKNLGARWDKVAKSWFVPEGADLAKFEKWLTPPSSAPTQLGVTSLTPPMEFAQALLARGLVVTGQPIMDGKIHRVGVIGGPPGAKDGAYIGYLDGHPAGYIQNFKTGEKETWKSKDYVLSDGDRTRLRAEAAATMEQRRLDREAEQLNKAQEYAAFLGTIRGADHQHPYLVQKGVGAHGIGQVGDKLILPLDAPGAKHWSYQEIGLDGSKRFAPGGRVQGCYHEIGGPSTSKQPVLIVEGYATAASIHEATGRPVVIAFNANNLKAVAEQWRRISPPERPIMIFGDDDRATKVRSGLNPGRSAAEEAAAAVGGRAFFPVFPPGDTQSTDFNDLQKAVGREGVKHQVEAFISMALSLPTEKSQVLAISRPKERQQQVDRSLSL